MQDKVSSLEAIFGMTLTGLLIGLGQLLGSNEKLTPRLVLGRAMSTVGIALVAGVSLLQLPDMPLIPLIGISALLASLGTSALERVIQHYLGLGGKK